MLCKETGKSGVNSRLIPFNMKGLFCVTLTDWPSFGVWRVGELAARLHPSEPPVCTDRKVACAPAAQSTWARRPCRNPERFSIWKGNQKIRGFILSLWSKPERKGIRQILTQSSVATGRIYWTNTESLGLCLLQELGGGASGVDWQWKAIILDNGSLRSELEMRATVEC